MIKYLFSDIDGTLYVNDDFHQNDKDKIYEFIDNGGVFALATGRSDFEIDNFAKEEDLYKPVFKVSCNGAMVLNHENERLFYQPIDKETCKKLYEFFIYNISRIHLFELGTKDMLYYMSSPINYTLDYKNEKYKIGKESLKKLISENIDVLKLYIEGSENFIHDLIHYSNKYLPGKLEIFNDLTAVNIVAGGINKGTGIKVILNKYNISPDEIAVVGDAANDIDMFKITKNSFSFIYSKDFVQEKSSYTVNNFAEAMEYIKNINLKK